MHSHLVLLFLAACLAATVTAFRKQKYAVRGQVFCPSNPSRATNVKVKLVDEDDGPDPDDTMATGKTDSSGSFTLSGSTRELTKIDPRLKIYHDCLDGRKPCQRRLKMYLPTKYINKGELDIGKINLEVKFPEEERDCIH